MPGKSLIGCFRCVWLGLELNSAGHRPSRTEFGQPCLIQLSWVTGKSWKEIMEIHWSKSVRTCYMFWLVRWSPVTPNMYLILKSLSDRWSAKVFCLKIALEMFFCAIFCHLWSSTAPYRFHNVELMAKVSMKPSVFKKDGEKQMKITFVKMTSLSAVTDYRASL